MLDQDTAFKEVLKRLDEQFPDKELLRIIDVMNFCGLQRESARELFPFNKRYISKVKLAKELIV